MLFSNITILNENFNIEYDKYIGINGNTIEYIGSDTPEKNYGRVYDGKGKLLMPGFVNCHGHSPMSLMRGYGENMKLQNWLFDKIFPFEAKLKSEYVYWGTKLSVAESLRYGIVSTSDMYYFVEDMIKSTSECGVKANISRAVVTTGDEFDKMPSIIEMKDTVQRYNGYDEGRIIVDSSLHAEYTSDETLARKLADYTKENNLNMHVHVSETKQEHTECKERHSGMTPVEYLNSCGIFDTNTVAAHCVWLEGDDMDILKEKKVTVATNPASNLKLASGICNVPDLLAKGINVALGTDSVASNNSLDFTEEMKLMALISKIRVNDPTVVTPKDVIRAATVCGAKGQGRDNTGEIKEGARADIIVMDISRPNMHPVHDLLNNIVFAASGTDVIMTMVDGRILYENGEYMTIDVEKTIAEADRCTKEMLSQL